MESLLSMILETIQLADGQTLQDAFGAEQVVDGASRKLFASGSIVRQAATCGTPPDVYFPPA